MAVWSGAFENGRAIDEIRKKTESERHAFILLQPSPAEGGDFAVSFSAKFQV
jgi:hypothetical protein